MNITARPVAMRRLIDQALAARRAATQPRHVGFGPCFIDEDQSSRVAQQALVFPSLPTLGDITINKNGALYLNLKPITEVELKRTMAEWAG